MPDNEIPSRGEARIIENERVEAEAASRRAESEASVMRSRAVRMHQIGGLAQIATEASQRETDAIKAAGDANNRVIPVDLEGVMPSLSDRTGTFATDISLVTAGGIGIDDSNKTGATNSANAVHPDAGEANQTGDVGGEAGTEGVRETAAQRRAREKAESTAGAG